MKRFPWIPYAISFIVILLLALFPVISVFIVYLVADANSCRVDEAGVYPCVVGDSDIGGLLAFMGLLGWLMLATIPLGGMALLLWCVVLVGHLLYRRYKSAQSGTSI
ncbi:hypothetical protein [Pelagibacterium halotolerans]|uniref:hypothetical protein n=1 Tax=Pelagibacterium halotolerans TaxID=531813 RepID=UPI00111522C6|nr:hypothetical protein [Pelagibacterium halotolerans]QJR17050.1 hypothetical protein HKM20_00350 [Pelagibacterium halotolerans]